MLIRTRTAWGWVGSLYFKFKREENVFDYIVVVVYCIYLFAEVEPFGEEGGKFNSTARLRARALYQKHVLAPLPPQRRRQQQI